MELFKNLLIPILKIIHIYLIPPILTAVTTFKISLPVQFKPKGFSTSRSEQELKAKAIIF
jgi:hypothetical protein